MEDFGEVSEVEGVVGLGWSGEQLGGDGGVDEDGGVHQELVEGLDLWDRFWWERGTRH